MSQGSGFLRRLAAALAGTVMAGCTVVGIRSGTEELSYTVVGQLGPSVEIRRYGPRLAAETVVVPEAGSDGRNDAFRILADYIFGNNRARSKIEMTVPVEVRASEKIAMTVPVEVAAAGGGADGLLMRFYMPATYTRTTLPEPVNPRVTIVELPETLFAVLTFSGDRDEAALAARQSELLGALAGSRWQPAGAFTALFYDPPWTLPFLRRNEVLVPVTSN